MSQLKAILKDDPELFVIMAIVVVIAITITIVLR
jgi:hypothetical protein